MAKFRVQGAKLIRMDNSRYPASDRDPGENIGDTLQPSDLIGGTLDGITIENGEVIFEVVGRIE